MIKVDVRKTGFFFVRKLKIVNKQQKESFKENVEKYKQEFKASKVNKKDLVRFGEIDLKNEIFCFSKELEKIEFIKKYGLLPRDFRKILRKKKEFEIQYGQKQMDFFVPSLVKRGENILLSLTDLQVIIQKDKAIVLDNREVFNQSELRDVKDSHLIFLKKLRKELEGSIDRLPFEFRVLESSLIHVLSELNTETKIHSSVLNKIFIELKNQISQTSLRCLLIESKKIGQLQRKSELIRNLLSEILENDDQLEDFYLTNKNESLNENKTFDHTDLEFLFETYYNISNEIVQKLEELSSQIKVTNEILNIVLESKRNLLIVQRIKYSLGFFFFTISIFIATVYGMNVTNFTENKTFSFITIITITLFSSSLLLRIITQKLKQLNKFNISKIRN